MAAELEKLAQDLIDKGFKVGGNLLRDHSQSLLKQELIPSDLSQPSEVKKPERKNGQNFEYEMKKLKFSKYLSESGMSTRTINAILRSFRVMINCDKPLVNISVDRFQYASDEEIKLGIRDIGKKSLEEIRKVFPRP